MEIRILDGFYEEGYHYYVQIEGNVLTLRDYARRLMLTTTISWDEEALGRGERTVLCLEDNVLSRSFDGEPMTSIQELAYENDSLSLDRVSTVLDEQWYTLKRVDHGPFDHLLILDDEWLPKLQGKWVNGISEKETLEIKEDHLTLFWEKTVMLEADIHVTALKTYPDQIQIRDRDLTRSDFGSYVFFDVSQDMLTTRMIVMDASMPLTAFVRPENVGKLKLPESVYDPVRNTMTNFNYNNRPMNIGFANVFPDMKSTDHKKVVVKAVENADGTWKCPVCGTEGNTGRFCPECGSPRP